MMQIRIRDLVNPGSGMEKVGSGILDKHPESGTLHLIIPVQKIAAKRTAHSISYRPVGLRGQ
jgi:hypothetical protein